jgi:hypothetical protein
LTIYKDYIIIVIVLEHSLMLGPVVGTAVGVGVDVGTELDIPKPG